VAARAEFLVTGDDDLLELHTFRGIRIVQPRDFEALFTD
jgi:predicted nucleic acid-binding protein